MIECAFDRILNPPGVETSAIFRRVPRSTKAALRECLLSQVTQCGDILQGCSFSTWRIVTGKRYGQIHFAFDQLKTPLLQRIQKISTLRRDFSLYTLPASEVCL